MSLRHALLALLAVQPMTGYDLAKQFDKSVAYMWHAPHSQIYPELRKLEADGLITAESMPRGERAVKRTYSITGSGLEELISWVDEITPMLPPRDAFRLKATYFEYGSYGNARRQFQAYVDHHEELLRRWELHVAQLENRATELIRRRLAAMPVELHDAIVAYKVHAYRGLIDRTRVEIRWGRRGLELIDSLEKASLAGGSAVSEG